MLIHGVATTWAFMSRLAEALTDPSVPGGPRHDQVVFVSHDWREPVRVNGRRIANWLETNRELWDRASLYGYSQGGMILRVAVERFGAARSKVEEVVTIHTPHRGCPLVRLARTLVPLVGCVDPRWSRVWRVPGVLDLAPGSALIRRLGPVRPPRGVAYRLLAGRRAPPRLRRVTAPFFLGRENDGVVTVESQLDRRAGHESHRVTRVVRDWNHFSLGVVDPEGWFSP